MSAADDIQAVLEGRARWVVLHARGENVLPVLPAKSVDHVITDPPYSEQIHKSVRSAKRNEWPDAYPNAGKNGLDYYVCRARRKIDLGFEHLSATLRRFCAREFARVSSRWVATFSDVESCHLWRRSLVASGLEYVRTAEWRRLAGAPQFTGDRPASGFETITLAHPRGRKRWNGGGKAGSYEFPVVQNCSGHRGQRVHPTQKPIELMMALVEDFTDPDEVVLDPFVGSGTTGVACLRLGRRFIGVEQDEGHAKTARERLAAEEAQSTIQAARAGQLGLFGSGKEVA